MKKIIKNGLIIDPSQNLCEEGNLYLDDDKIVMIELAGKTLGEAKDFEETETIDATGLWVTPGLIDLHVHFREPGLEYKEDIKSGSEAAIHGGFTTVCMMPNTKPVIDSVETLEYVDKKAKEADLINVLTIAAITKGQKGEELCDYEKLMEVDTITKKINGKGICAISEDGRSVMNSKVMLEGIKEAKELNLQVFSHTEDDSLASTSIGEELIVARDIMLANEADARIHLCHISTKNSLDIIKTAKERGINVTCETGPHYFIFNKDDVNGDPNKKMNPPLRSKEDVEAVKEALRNGTIDVIATDHAPHSKEEKSKPIEKALNGIVGIETSFALSYTYLVKTGILTPLELINKMSTKGAKILDINRGTLKVGSVADIALFDVTNEYEIKEEDFKSKSHNSPFIGMNVYGRTVQTFVAGKCKFKR